MRASQWIRLGFCEDPRIGSQRRAQAGAEAPRQAAVAPGLHVRSEYPTDTEPGGHNAESPPGAEGSLRENEGWASQPEIALGA